MKKVGFIYHDMFLRHEMPPGHPESKDRLIVITEALKKSGMWDQITHIKPKKADKADIVAVHSASYFEKMLSFNGYFDADTFVSDDSVEAALYAAGAVNIAIDRCAEKELDRAFCAVRPPGHHAESNRAMGFCIFNNIAVGARFAQNAGHKKVFIIDFDVHHGNGTQHIFEEDDTVFYFSTHQYPHYPGTGSDAETGLGKGKGYTYNIPMHHGSGDKEYLSAYQDTLPGLITNFNPDIVLVSAGYDLHSKDPLAGIRVSNEGIRAVVRGILTAKKDIPYIFALEGGYSLTALSESVVITVEELFSA